MKMYIYNIVDTYLCLVLCQHYQGLGKVISAIDKLVVIKNKTVYELKKIFREEKNRGLA